MYISICSHGVVLIITNIKKHWSCEKAFKDKFNATENGKDLRKHRLHGKIAALV